MQLQSNELMHLLEIWPVARLASVTGDGKPQMVPIVFVVDEAAIYSPVDGKPKQTSHLQRMRNVATNPHVSMLIDHYTADWRELWWVRIDASAEVATDASMDTAALRRVEAKLRSKYPQYHSVPVFHGATSLLRLTIDRHIAWSARTMDWLTLEEPQL
jgi:PPOX class probable F420-dependent enzyme